MNRKRVILAIVVFLMGIRLVFSQTHAPDPAIYIKAGKLFDSERGQLLTDYTIKVENRRITAVGERLVIPDGAQVIDLSGYTVLPGLIDGHTHLLTLESLTQQHYITDQILFEGDALRVLRGAGRAATFLDAGITTVRDLGDSGQFLDVALKRAIEEGTTTGPRMFVSGPIIASEGGQVVGMVKGKRDLISGEYTIIKNVDEAINAVREHITYGADLIKICANNTPNPTSLTLEEMKAIVTMAHRYKRKVTAHATSNLAVWEAVMAGVDGIEHGYQIADSTLQLMAKKGVALIPTDLSYELAMEYFRLVDFQGDQETAAKEWLQGSHDRLQRALAAGVTIVTGSDNYINFEMPQGLAAKHVIKAYLEAGMDPLQILRSSTYLSARFMERQHELGVIKEGAFADIIAVKGDVEGDFSTALFDVVFVMKDGKVHLEKP